MSHPSPSGALIITETPEQAIKTALLEQGWLVEEANNPAQAQAALTSGKRPIVLIDVAFYYKRGSEVSALRAAMSPQTPYFIALSDSYEEDVDEAEDVYARGSALSGLVRRVQRGFRHLATLDFAQRAQNLLLEKQREMEDNEEYVQEVTKQLVEMTAQLQGEMLCNQAHEAERINMAKIDTILQATGTLRHKIFNPLFAIQANTEGALRYLNFWLESGVTEVAPIIEKLDCALEGSSRIHSVVDAFSKLVVPTTQDYLPGMQMLALDDELEEANRLIA